MFCNDLKRTKDKAFDLISQTQLLVEVVQLSKMTCLIDFVRLILSWMGNAHLCSSQSAKVAYMPTFYIFIRVLMPVPGLSGLAPRPYLLQRFILSSRDLL